MQNNCKNYCKFLLEDLGYAGFRYDMVKGYNGRYNKMYNEYSGTQFSVGEYWDSNYDAVKGWIDATGKQSAAFDFPCKYAINDAFHSNNLTKLVWKANGTTNQPAGMIHFGYSQYAVTFVDNHDTYRDGSKFNGNVVAANAFILCSPGTPCVFLPHWKAHKAEIAKLIEIRNAVGLHNNSAVNVLQSSNNCYMAEVTGTKGKLVVKIGSAQVSPAGYTNADIKASGNDYCVWTKADIDNPGIDDPGVTPGVPANLYVMGNLKQGFWQTNVGVTMTKNDKVFTAKGVELVAVTGETKAFFTLVTALGTTGASSEWDDVINSSDRYGATEKDETLAVNTPTTFKKFTVDVDASSANSWAVTPGSYDITVDFGTNKITIVEAGSNPDVEVDLPEHLYLIGNIQGAHWSTSNPVEMAPAGNKMYAKVVFEPAAGKTHCFFNLAEKKGSDWPDVNGGHRYGAESEGVEIPVGQSKKWTKYEKNVNASACKSFKVLPGEYFVTADFAKQTITVSKNDITGVENIGDDNLDVAPVYYNLQGVRVNTPTQGLYIVVRGNKVTKELVR